MSRGSAVMYMEKLYAKHTKSEVPVINVVSGITFNVKLHQASFLFWMATNILCLAGILKL